MVVTRFLSAIFLTLLIGCETLMLGNANENNIQKRYDYTVIDVHNHDASGYKFLSSFDTWNRFGISKVVLFGDISEPSAISSDRIAYEAYRKYPTRFIPFIAGININDVGCVDYIRESFMKGIVGVGEIVVSSKYSPVASNLPWKADGIDDARLSPVFAICNEFGRPILIHIDPIEREQLIKLIGVSRLFPNAFFIVGHANAYSNLPDLKYLLEESSNIYLDIFPGFTAFNTDSKYSLEDFVELMENYPSRCFLSSDSGFGIGYELSYQAIHILLSKCDPRVARKIASENFENVLRTRIK